MLIEITKPDFVFENESGCLKQLVHDGWKQVNVITSLAGSKRGGHYHKFNKEGFYVVDGCFTLSVWKGAEKEAYEMKAGDMFVILPYVFHTFDYKEDTVLVSMYSQGVELSDTEKDIWTEGE
ncbi:MAG: cupin domain-containing protein [Oscillospiraceae bacterium]|nr:cupin domain-containing protein [Oscillospiraceae bacterium]